MFTMTQRALLTTLSLLEIDDRVKLIEKRMIEFQPTMKIGPLGYLKYIAHIPSGFTQRFCQGTKYRIEGRLGVRLGQVKRFWDFFPKLNSISHSSISSHCLEIDIITSFVLLNNFFPLLYSFIFPYGHFARKCFLSLSLLPCCMKMKNTEICVNLFSHYDDQFCDRAFLIVLEIFRHSKK